MRKITKVVIALSIDRNLSELMESIISNKSKYIEYLVYQDMKRNNVDGIDKIII